MAVTPGTTISQADLAALASLANGKTTLPFNVSPMYSDGLTDWGYRTFAGVAISAPGSGYKPGDSLGLGFSATATVEQVDASGGVTGIRMTNMGAGQYTDSPSSPISVTGGSGAGCQLSFSSFGQYGPTAAYSFPEYYVNAGSVTGLYLVSDGSGYSASDSLTVPDCGAVLTVNTVDGSGKILTWTISTAPTTTSVPASVAAMATTGGTGGGATFGGYFTLGQKPQWLTELNRLRVNLKTLTDLIGTNTNVSGPWPSVYGSSFYYNAGEYTGGTGATPDLDFYYADPSPTVVTASLYEEGYLALYDLTDPSAYLTSTSITAKIRVGGTLDVTLMARFGFSYTEISPGSSVVTGSSTLPGFGGFALQVGSYGNPPVWCALINGTVPPGDYDITASITGGIFNINAIYVQGYPQASRPAGSDSSYQCWASTNGSPTLVAGIHNSKDIYKISVPADSNNTSFGLYAYYPFPERPYSGPEFFWHWKRGGSYNLSFNVPGFVTYKTYPVSSLNCPPLASMPWNLPRTKYGSSGSATVNPALLGDLAPTSNPQKVSNSYNQSLPVELQIEPPTWVASRYFTVGFSIVDSNGNFQVVQTAGTSGSSAPGWAATDGATTGDGSVTWKCLIVDGMNPIVGKEHRSLAVPPYPYYWQGNNSLATTWAATTAYALNDTCIDANGNTQKVTTAGTSGSSAPAWNQTIGGTTTDGTVAWTLITLVAETNAFLMPPTPTSGLTRWGAYNQWQRNNYHGTYDAGWQQDNKAFGWWIYSVTLARMQTNPSSQVAVTIGCIRNGVFVSFGTWNTGQTIQVLWPIFTSDALVYQCSERVDIQAVAIASGGAGVSVGATVSGYPVCAAFVSDVTALLNLIT